MKADCFEIGTFQAFLDGELSQTQAASLTAHTALCDRCAGELASAEDESAIVFPALAREMDTLVPTQRLWNKINDAIAAEQESRPFWEKAWAFLRVSLTNPSLIAAASLILVFGVFTALWINRATTPGANSAGPEIASSKNPVTRTVVSDPTSVDPAEKKAVTPQRFEQAAYRPSVEPRPVIRENRAPNLSNGYMPGEESYVKTISSLSKTVEGQKDGAMRPSERVAYERDMAVVNDAIEKMKTEVRKNPKNESAKQVLYSSYQNKIDLLTSVSQKEELIASLR